MRWYAILVRCAVRGSQVGTLAAVFILSFFAPQLRGQEHAQQDLSVSDHFQKGQQAAARLDYDRAIEEFRAVLKIDATIVQARANLGLMYYAIGEYSSAANELSKAARSQPDLLPAQLFFGLSELKLGRPADAISALRHATQLDPNNAEAARGLLSSYISLEKYTLALREIQFFKSRSDQESLFVTGQAYLDMGKRLTERLALKYRGSAWAHQLAGDLAADRNDAKTASDEYAKARAVDPSLPDPNSLASSPTSPTELAVQLTGHESAELLYRLIRMDTRLGEQYFEALQNKFPDSALAHQLRGDVYRLRQDFPSALVEFQAAAQERGDDAELHQSIGEMCIQLHRLDEAKAELEQAAKLNHRSAQTNYLLGQVFTKENELETAASYLRESVQLDPDLLAAHALLGTVYMHMGKSAQAAPELEKALSLDYYGDLHFQLYRAYRALGQTALAEKALASSKKLRQKSLNRAEAKISDPEGFQQAPNF